MIAYIKGKITHKSPTYIYLDVQGIGYHVNISLNTYNEIKEFDNVKLYTYLQIREDAHSLHGFYDKLEKEIFLNLISVSGIGTVTALIILSSMSPYEVQQAIIQEDVIRFKGVKGIGPKTAKRMMLELKDKIAKVNISGEEIIVWAHNTIQNEALSALLTLGINKQSAEKSINRVIKTRGKEVSVEDVIKDALKNI
jgi:Holliday junction DNA helicase RuvA